mmetsp:Transcript_35419/g.60184  ORF Transcript_35419/g.60184 Transcript_35419/m.60184 type:complete len:90 (+) Transcript_35419:172-441(+)
MVQKIKSLQHLHIIFHTRQFYWLPQFQYSNLLIATSMQPLPSTRQALLFEFPETFYKSYTPKVPFTPISHYCPFILFNKIILFATFIIG